MDLMGKSDSTKSLGGRLIMIYFLLVVPRKAQQAKQWKKECDILSISCVEIFLFFFLNNKKVVRQFQGT